MFRKILAAIICIFTLATSLTSCGFFAKNDGGENISYEEALDIAKEYWKDRDMRRVLWQGEELCPRASREPASRYRGDTHSNVLR